MDRLIAVVPYTCRRSRCIRVVLEDALPAEAAEYVRYSALKTQLDFDAILSVETDLKRVITAKLDDLLWMDNQTRKRARKRLRDLKVGEMLLDTITSTITQPSLEKVREDLRNDKQI